MRRIHPTAVVDPAAELADDVVVGPQCVVEGGVRIGARTELSACVVVQGDTVLGEDNFVHPGAVLGAPPQDLKHRGERTRLVVGDRNQIREHVTFHLGTVPGGGVTTVGSGGLFMVGCHVAHDCRIGDGVILANHVLLAGHVTVQDRAILNGAAACHHFATVGRFAYVGGMTRVTHDVPPFTIAEGDPVEVRGANIVGLRRAGFPADAVELVQRVVWDVFVNDDETTRDAIARWEQERPGDPLLSELFAFVRASEQGRHGRAAERRAGAAPAPSA